MYNVANYASIWTLSSVSSNPLHAPHHIVTSISQH